MRARKSLPLLCALAGLVAAGAGCRTRVKHDEPAADAVGFELPGNGAVAHGALLTKPPGREEPFVPYVAVGATGWVAACRGEAGATSPLFSFETDAHGALRAAAADAGATPRDRCLAARAAAGAAPSGLPAETRVTVQLALRAP
ncbi:MAG TPA: hypothetical protein VGP64_03140 [Polyangia bacterium]|jgi:hypothetical protein